MTELIADVGIVEGFTVTRVATEIDLYNATEFAEAITEAVGEASPGVIVDLSSVLYIDSAGVRALFDVVRRLEARRQVVALAVAASSPIRTLINVTHMQEAVPVCDSPEACAAALRQTAKAEHRDHYGEDGDGSLA